jgi:cellulose synthase/poly-beta-1,6-N-acetylglucosamine synthase-like glycosyltransferase
MITIALLVVWAAYFILLYMVIFWIIVFLEKGIVEEDLKLTNFPVVTVAIPAYNEEDCIKGTLESVLNLDYPRDKLEVIVVNDGSVDKTKSIVDGLIAVHTDFDIKLINQANRGKGAAINRALAVARGEFFVTFDSDSFISSNALKKILPHFSDKRVAAVMPLMKVKDPKTFIQKIQWCEYLINLFYKRLMSMLDCVHVAPGPFSVYRKSIIQELGGFDESNITEDLEMSLRLQKNNYKLIQILNTEVYTIAPNSLRSFYKQRNRWYKGTLLNALKYRKLVFNRNYGDFGFIQMPRILLESFIVLCVVFITLYMTIFKPLYTKLYNLYFVNYNIMVYVHRSIDAFSIIDINFVNLFFGGVVTAFALYLIVLAHRHTKEPMTRYGIVVIPSYLFFYSILAFTALVGVAFDLVRGKVQKW